MRLFLDREKKKKLESTWSAHGRQVPKQRFHTLGYGTHCTEKTNTNNAKMGNSLIEEMRVQR